MLFPYPHMQIHYNITTADVLHRMHISAVALNNAEYIAMQYLDGKRGQIANLQSLSF